MPKGELVCAGCGRYESKCRCPIYNSQGKRVKKKHGRLSTNVNG